MKIRTFLIAALAACLLAPATGRAQDQAQSKFQIAGKALGYAGGGTGLVAADAVTLINLAPKVAIRTDNIVLSAAASEANLAVFSLGGAEYALPSGKLFKALALDPAKFRLYAVGETGTVTNAAGVTAAYSAGAGLDRLTDALTINLFEVRWLHGPVPVGNLADGSPRYVRDGLAVSVGLTF